MRSVGDVSDVLLSFSRAFQRRRFESFCGVLLSLSVVRSKGDVSRVFLATISHSIGTKPAGVCFFACAPQRPFSRQRFGLFCACGFVAAFTLRRGSFLSLFQLGCATVVVQLPCFRTCVASGLQICSAGGYFFLVLFRFRRQRFASFLLAVS